PAAPTRFTWTPRAGDEGDHVLTYRRDYEEGGDFLVITRTLTIRVEPAAPTGPDLDAGAPSDGALLPVLVGQTLTYKITAAAGHQHSVHGTPAGAFHAPNFLGNDTAGAGGGDLLSD